jgi:hypothetical protein
VILARIEGRQRLSRAAKPLLTGFRESQLSRLI